MILTTTRVSSQPPSRNIPDEKSINNYPPYSTNKYPVHPVLPCPWLYSSLTHQLPFQGRFCVIKLQVRSWAAQPINQSNGSEHTAQPALAMDMTNRNRQCNQFHPGSCLFANGLSVVRAEADLYPGQNGRSGSLDPSVALAAPERDSVLEVRSASLKGCSMANGKAWT